MTKVIIQVQVDEEVLAKAEKVLSGKGLSASQAVELFLERVVSEGKLPFDRVPNAETIAAMLRLCQPDILKSNETDTQLQQLRRQI